MNDIDISENQQQHLSKTALEISKLRLSPDRQAQMTTKKVALVTQLQKPNRDTFFQIHPEHSLECHVLKTNVSGTDELYLVTGEVEVGPGVQVQAYVLRLGQTRQGVDFVFPIRLPDSSRNSDPWAESMLMAVKLAETNWIKLVANTHAGAYEAHVAQGNFPPPVWPAKSFENLVLEAVRGRVIDSDDHPILRKLRGEI